MQDAAKKKIAKDKPLDPRVAAVRRILNIAQLVRQRGTPEEALEAVEWERRLNGRLEELESQPVSRMAA